MRWLLFTILLGAGAVHAHPGSAIAVAKNGRVYFVDTGGGVFSADASGRIVRHDGPAFHWFALDPGSRFRATAWPHVANGQLHSAGVKPTVVLSSDFPIAIGADGRLYYPEPAGGGRIRLAAIDPSGAKSIRATLPPVSSAGRHVSFLNGLAAGADGSLFYAEDRAVRRIDPRGRVSTVVENVAVPNCSAIPGIGRELGPHLRGLAVAADGTIYVAAAGCGAVLRIDSRKQVSVVLRASPPWSPTAVAVANGEAYVLEYLHTLGDDRSQWIPRVRRVSKRGTVSTFAGTPRTRK